MRISLLVILLGTNLSVSATALANEARGDLLNCAHDSFYVHSRFRATKIDDKTITLTVGGADAGSVDYFARPFFGNTLPDINHVSIRSITLTLVTDGCPAQELCGRAPIGY